MSGNENQSQLRRDRRYWACPDEGCGKVLATSTKVAALECSGDHEPTWMVQLFPLHYVLWLIQEETEELPTAP